MWDFVSAYWVYLLIAAFFLVTITSLLGVGLIEKQRVRDFGPVPPDNVPPASPYFKAMNEAAGQLGYGSAEVVGQARNSSTYRCTLALWLSPDKRALLCIFGGKLAGVNYKRTILFSKLENGRVLQTIDEAGGDDLSGTRDIDLLLNASLPELHELHQRRLATAHVPAIEFRSSNLLQQYEALNELRVKALLDRGLARFVDAQGNTFRYTFKGALLNATSGYLKGMKRAQAQKERVKIKRPGA